MNEIYFIFFDNANLLPFDISKDFAFDFYIKDNTN